MKPQKHAAVIKAWADGATIQHRLVGSKNWITWSYKINSPNWLDDTEYRASIAEVEGKPVFEGDVLYSPEGKQFKAHPYETMFHFASWNPPRPKTITVELLREDAEYLASAVIRPFDMGARVVNSLRKALK